MLPAIAPSAFCRRGNKSTGADATADYILTADNGTDTVNYLDLGIINSGYDPNTPTNSLGKYCLCC
jgi:hypothetical protein